MILITGATGFLGAHLVYVLLKKGCRLRALKRETSSMTYLENVFASYSEVEKKLTNQIEWVNGDLLDIFSLQDALEGITDVYHCAALVSFDPACKKEMIKTNVLGTANLVDACLVKGIRRFCHVSSIGALGSNESGELIDELTPRKSTSSHSPYSQSKYFSELEVWRGIAEGMDAVIVNPAVILDPARLDNSTLKMLNLIQKGLMYYTSGTNGYVDVRDVVNVMVLLMDIPESGERYVVVSENISYKKLLEMIAVKLGKAPPDKKAGKILLSIIVGLSRLKSKMTGKPVLLSHDQIRALTETSKYSAQKLITKTGYNFLPVETTVNELCTSYIKSKS